MLGAFAGAAVLGGVLWAVERRARETILPFELLRRRPVAVGTLALWLIGMAMLGTIVYVPLFVQGVLGTSATSAGVLVIPFMLGAVVASVAAGQWVSRTGRYKAVVVAGLAVLPPGCSSSGGWTRRRPAARWRGTRRSRASGSASRCR